MTFDPFDWTQPDDPQPPPVEVRCGEVFGSSNRAASPQTCLSGGALAQPEKVRPAEKPRQSPVVPFTIADLFRK